MGGKQGNYSLRRPPKLVIPQAVIGQRWATVYSNLYKQTVIHSKSTRYRTRCPLCCFLDSHLVVSVTPFAVSVTHFVEMYSHFVDSVTHFVVSDQQSGNVYFQNVIRRPEC